MPESLLIAQVRIDSPLPQLDRPFDYAVPAGLDVVFGSRVRVRFAGRLVSGLVVGLARESEREGALRPVERVLGPEPVLRPEILQLAEAVAERYAGTVRDVLRAAIPPRHARAEERAQSADAADPPSRAGSMPPDLDQAWSRYRHGPALVRRLQAESRPPVRAAWACAPAGEWPREIAAAVQAVLGGTEGGVIIVVPDAWDVRRVRQAVAPLGDAVAVLTADLGPQRRYQEFLRVLRGQVRVVIGTRGAVFAPMPRCTALIVWNDGDEALWDPQAPYWNARDVAALRSHLTGCALLVGSPARSTAVQAWCEQGWARSVDPLTTVVRQSGPIVRGLDGPSDASDAAASAARIPHLAWLVAKEGLRTGPVLVQVPRRGYLPALACQACRAPAVCACSGPLGMTRGSSVPACAWCAALATAWACRSCGSTRIRAVSIGVERTAEEFGRAFPGVAVVWSAGEQQRRTTSRASALVVATPGSEPVVTGGYAAVIILDGRSQLQRQGMRAAEDAVHRWFSAAMLASPGAHVVVTAEHSLPPVQALVRWNAAWFAQRELAERRSAGLPPWTRFAVLRGPTAEIEQMAAGIGVPHRVLGPVDDRLMVVADRSDGMALAGELRALTAIRAARGDVPVRISLDPWDI
ncbi:MAG: primosomal protein N' [Actinomycetales bacterium]|nr:primosomal protein N' [Actinomycetales bacterium]